MRNIAYFLIPAILLSSLSGCCCVNITAAREAARRAQSANNLHQLGIAIHRYHSIKGEWPSDIYELDPHLANMLPQLIVNPVTGDDPGYEYVNPEPSAMRDIIPFNTILIYQLRDGQRDLELDVLYSDGAVAPLGRETP